MLRYQACAAHYYNDDSNTYMSPRTHHQPQGFIPRQFILNGDEALLILSNMANKATVPKSSQSWALLPNHGLSGFRLHALASQLFTQLFNLAQIKETSKLRVTGLCAEHSPLKNEFPAQMARNAENISIWRPHHVCSSVLSEKLWLSLWLSIQHGRWCFFTYRGNGEIKMFLCSEWLEPRQHKSSGQ